MKLVKSNGGVSIAVYDQARQKTAEQLMAQKRVNFIAPADYRINQRLDTLLKDVINVMAAQASLSHYAQ
jgi:hypothetical protein